MACKSTCQSRSSIQNPADLQWLATNPANVQVSGEFRLDTFSHATKSLYLFVLWLGLFLLPTVMADLPKGSWSMSGDIVDVRMSSRGPEFTNTLSLTGHYDNGRFLIDLVPIKSEDEIAESAGWDGNILRVIQRGPKFPGKSLPPDMSLGIVEPSVFSRYATHALTSVLLAFAGSNAMSRLEAGQDLVILGGERLYPEENNTYTIKYLSSNNVEIEAICPGQQIESTGMVPVIGFEHGFTRWMHKSSLTNINGTNDASMLLVEYKRFRPFNGKLIQERSVIGSILFRLEEPIVSDFRPIIKENVLSVRDYSCRELLFPLSKGLIDQNYMYNLTSKNWNFDTNIIVAEFEKRKTYLIAHGIPKEVMDVPNNIQPQGSRRSVVLCGLIVFSILSAGVLWFGRGGLCRVTKNK